MSQAYKALKAPVTSLYVAKPEGGHVNLIVRINKQSAGTLRLKEDELADVVKVFADHDKTAARTHFGGAGVGCVVTVEDATAYQCIGDDGELLTLADLRRKHGKGA